MSFEQPKKITLEDVLATRGLLQNPPTSADMEALTLALGETDSKPFNTELTFSKEPTCVIFSRRTMPVGIASARMSVKILSLDTIASK